MNKIERSLVNKYKSSQKNEGFKVNVNNERLTDCKHVTSNERDFFALKFETKRGIISAEDFIPAISDVLDEAGSIPDDAMFTINKGVVSVSLPDTPANIPADTPADIPADTPADIPANIPADIPANIPADTPANVVSVPLPQ